MFSTLGFLFKTVLFVAVLAIIGSLGGYIAIHAYGYDIQVHLGLFVIVALILFYTASLFIRIGEKIAAVPKAIRQYSEKRDRHSGMRSLTYGLSAVAAGDIRAATHYTKKANRLLSDDYGLVALLSGLTARLKGNEPQAEESFKSLLDRNETAFLGIRGLLQIAMERGDICYARTLAQQAYAINRKQPWVIRTLYDLELRMKDFDAALPVLRQAVRTKTLDREQALKDEAAIALYRNDIVTAYKLSPQYLPAILAILPNLPTRKARKLIEKTWRKTPHPILLEQWISLAPKKSGYNKALKIMRWIEKLYMLNPDDASCNLYVAECAINYHQEKQARRFLNKALELKPTIRVYQLLARVAESDGHDHKQARSWMELVPTAAHDKTWICTKSGRLYHEWGTYADNDRYFNTIEWAYPDDIRTHNTGSAPSNTSFFLTDSHPIAA